jgi:hypothetical protein
VKASVVAALALGLLVLGRWAHDKPALNVQTVVGGAFVILVIAMLDTGRTEEIAQGIAWILLAVIALSKESPLTAIAAAASTKITGTSAQQQAQPGGPSA